MSDSSGDEVAPLGIPRRPSQSILRQASKSDAEVDNNGGAGGQHQHQQTSERGPKRASFSRNDPERFEFAPNSAPGGIGGSDSSFSKRRKPRRSSLRSSGESQRSFVSGTPSVVSETSTTSTWSRAQRLLCCLDRSKPRGPVATFLVHLLCCPYHPPERVLGGMTAILESWVYGIPFLLFTVLLLFGQSVQDLWCPPQSDDIFNGFYLAAFVFFVLDIAMRCYVSPPYFTLECCGRDWRHDAGPGRRPRIAQGGMRNGWFMGGLCVRVGSFMFWCDLVSTLTLLYDVSWVNRRLLTRTTIAIVINKFGIPVAGDEINVSSPFENNWGIVISIGRTARIARFVRATAIVKTFSSILNWICLSHIFDPTYWIRRCLGGARDGNEKGYGTILEDLAAAETATTPRARRKSSFVRKGGGGGSLASTAAAAAAAQAQYDLRGGVFKSVVAFFTCAPCRDVFREKRLENVAAKKIQKAWRLSSGGKMMSTKDSESAVRSILPPSIRRGKSTTSSASSSSGRRKQETQVGSAMRELTGQRVALGIMITLVLTVFFSYAEVNSTPINTMVLLHSQTQINEVARERAIGAALTVMPTLYIYQDANNVTTEYLDIVDPSTLREREKVEIHIAQLTDSNTSTSSSMGVISAKEYVQDLALARLISTIFIIFVWLFGVTAFAGPVMTLVVVPIERMVRLLTMLMRDPLGYQSTPRYKRFVSEEDEFLKTTRWTKDVLKGMETSFLMSTILRIGSLMKVGFGSAGVEIIRQNLEQGQKKNGLFLNSKGSTVSCVFLFCDIRQFTDATESLQEEVFVFTNKIAAVVHSICHSYGGSANKNIGDAFLVSWLLDDGSKRGKASRDSSLLDSFGGAGGFNSSGAAFGGSGQLTSGQNQADKALLSVVKICVALYNDKFYVESMSEEARDRLLAKIAKRQGPVVQMGFGLHAGKAVQGAIGSERKLDATYLSEAVERSEFLESSTKKYGLKMLMSNAFYDLLDSSIRRRCRKIDQLILCNEDDEDDDYDILETGEVMELYTYDIDVEAMWKENQTTASGSEREGSASEDGSLSGSLTGSLQGLNILTSNASTKSASKRDLMRFAGGVSRRNMDGGRGKGMRRRVSLVMSGARSSRSSSDHGMSSHATTSKPSAHTPQFEYGELNERGVPKQMPELVLPTTTARYSAAVWNREEMKVIRKKYSDGLFFQKFNAGLQSFYAPDWEHARQCFRAILERMEDGPSRYFLNQIEENNGTPPRNWIGYGLE